MRHTAPRVKVTADSDLALERDSAARAARLPHEVFEMVRAALPQGPVLVQVPRAGLPGGAGLPGLPRAGPLPVLRRARSGPTARAPRAAPGAAGSQVDWECPICGWRRVRAPVVGAERTAEELGKAFPQDARPPVGRRPDAALGDRISRRIVVATPGAEPPADGGYAGAVLLGHRAVAAPPGAARGRGGAAPLAERRGARSAAAADGGSVIAVGESSGRALQALVRVDPGGFAARELAERARGAASHRRSELSSSRAQPATLDEFVALARLPAGAEVLGPVEVRCRAGSRAVACIGWCSAVRESEGPALARAAKEVAAIRSARKSEGALRIRVDPVDLVTRHRGARVQLLRMRVVFAGTPDVAVPTLDALLASRHEVVAVVTRPDAPRGRGKRLAASPVAARAAELGLEILRPQRPRDEEFVDRLTALEPECCPVVAYGALLPQRVLDIPKHGWVNLHFSLLPAWRGAAPVQHAIIAGDRCTGATTFRIVLELDAGPIYATVTEPVLDTDTAGDLLARLSHRRGRPDGAHPGRDRGRHPGPRPQPESQTSYAAKITVEDAEIDWTAPADVIDRLIRGTSPAPGRLDHVRRRAVQDQLGRTCRSPPGTGRSGDLQAHGGRRNRHPSAATRRGPATGQAADARRRLGARGGVRPRSGSWLLSAVRSRRAARPGPAPGLRRPPAGQLRRRVRQPGRRRTARRAAAGQRVTRHSRWNCWPGPAAGWAPTTVIVEAAADREHHERPAGRARPVPARYAPDPGDAGAGPGRRRGHRRPRRGHGGGAGHRAGQRGPPEGGR